MGWFDKQIRQTYGDDQSAFEESILQMATAVMDERDAESAHDDRIATKQALDEILKHYRFKPVDLPDKVVGLEESLDYCLRPCGIMYRRVKLEGAWYEDMYEAALAFRKDDGCAVALVPAPFYGYWCVDPRTGSRVRVNKAVSEQFEPDAICFYRPLPSGSLTESDLLHFIGKCVGTSHRLHFVATSIIAAFVAMLQPYLTRFLTGFVYTGGNNMVLIGTAAFMLCYLISQHLLQTVRSVSVDRMQNRPAISVEAALMSRLINLPTTFFRQYSSGELASRVNSAKTFCQRLVGDVIVASVTALISLLYVVQIVKFTPALVIPGLAVVIINLVIGVVVSLRQSKTYHETMELATKTSGLSFQLINGLQKIKLAGAEKRAYTKWSQSYAKQARVAYNPAPVVRVSNTLTLATSLLGTIVLYYVAVKTQVAPSEYIAFNSAYGMVSAAFASVSGIAMTAAQIKPTIEMIQPILSEEPETSLDREIVTSVSGSIDVSNLYFRYSPTSPYVVDGLNLRIRSGEYLAICGTTGCGKSTLVRLLLGFEKPERGAIHYDRKDLSKVDLRSLRRKIGIVTQDGSLFPGSIYSNIVITNPELTMDDAWEAAEIAGIAEDIRNMPMGMHTMISEGQGGISGGQRQRIMIARAVASKPRIIILDEATSALDNMTQRQVAESLDKMHCTRIVIAHRLSTIKNCDRIIMLDAGHIVEDGTYDELIEQGGQFAELVARQRLD